MNMTSECGLSTSVFKEMGMREVCVWEGGVEGGGRGWIGGGINFRREEGGGGGSAGQTSYSDDAMLESRD